MPAKILTVEQVIQRYTGKVHQLQREAEALENNKSYLLIGEKDVEGNLSSTGEEIKKNALGYNEIMIGVYSEFITVLKKLKGW